MIELYFGFLDLRVGVNEISVLLGHDVASLDIWFSGFQKKHWSHELLLSTPMSETKPPVTQRHIPEDRIPQDFSSCTVPGRS